MSKVCLSLALAFGAFILLGLAAIAASLFAPFNLFVAFVLGIVGSFLILGIIRTWRQPDGWRFALVAAAVGVLLWAYFEYGSSYVAPPIGSRFVRTP
jgi:uncharacterized membrane protein YeaQ/YmgE (transglycosylase-associated protein family)